MKTKIDALLQSNMKEDVLLAINLIDKLPEKEFWDIVKQNLQRAGIVSTDYILYKPENTFRGLYCIIHYIKGKNAYYFFNNDVLVIDSYKTAEKEINRSIEIIEEWT
ncbi:MAG: hypothetical protein AABY22_11530 [Nanoarchaeota archaeon]